MEGQPWNDTKEKEAVVGMELSPLWGVGEIEEPTHGGAWIQDFILTCHGDHLGKNQSNRKRELGVVPRLAHSLGTHPASHWPGGSVGGAQKGVGRPRTRLGQVSGSGGVPPDATPSVPDLARDRHRNQDAHPLPQYGDHRPLPLTCRHGRRKGGGGGKLEEAEACGSALCLSCC